MLSILVYTCTVPQDLPASGEVPLAVDRELLLMKATSAATLSCLENCLSILQQQQNNFGLSSQPHHYNYNHNHHNAMLNGGASFTGSDLGARSPIQ